MLFQASRDKWLNAKERRQANRIASLQEKIGQVQEAASLREQNLSQEIRRGREEKEREVNFLKQEIANREEELNKKLARLGEEYEKLKSNMVSTGTLLNNFASNLTNFDVKALKGIQNPSTIAEFLKSDAQIFFSYY